MRIALWCVLAYGVPALAAAQDRAVTFEEPPPVTISGFAVGSADYQSAAKTNTFTAGKVGLSLFKPFGDAYLFAQLTTALEDDAVSTDIDNLLINWTPSGANKWSLGFGKFDAPIGFERDDEPLNLIATNSFNFVYARPGKLVGAQVHYTASPRFEVWGVVANGWDLAVDNNRGKTAMVRAQVVPIPWFTIGLNGVYGPERDSTDAHQRSLLTLDLTFERGPVILGAELNGGREQDPVAAPTWKGAAVTGFVRIAPKFGIAARYDQVDDPDGLMTGVAQNLRSVTIGPTLFFSTAREGIFSNVEHTTFHIPQVTIRGAVRFDHSTQPFFANASGGLNTDNTSAVLELVYVF